jgi:hypothetical protein
MFVLVVFINWEYLAYVFKYILRDTWVHFSNKKLTDLDIVSKIQNIIIISSIVLCKYK